MIDWMPTLASLAGVQEGPELFDGEDVSDIWLGETRERRGPLYWKASAAGAMPVMRDGDWKFHLNRKPRGEPELYDLSKDPSESHNVAAEHPDVVSRLTQSLNAWSSELPKSYEKLKGKKNDDR
jgi:N-acetylgalactosamine-6-sulfatase